MECSCPETQSYNKQYTMLLWKILSEQLWNFRCHPSISSEWLGLIIEVDVNKGLWITSCLNLLERIFIRKFCKPFVEYVYFYQHSRVQYSPFAKARTIYCYRKGSKSGLSFWIHHQSFTVFTFLMQHSCYVSQFSSCKIWFYIHPKIVHNWL